MHDQQRFQAETIKAIIDLQEVFISNQARYLAMSAVLKALLNQVALPALRQIRENYLAEVDSQASEYEPRHQRAQHWADWEVILDSLVQREEARPSGPRLR